MLLYVYIDVHTQKRYSYRLPLLTTENTTLHLGLSPGCHPPDDSAPVQQSARTGARRDRDRRLPSPRRNRRDPPHPLLRGFASSRHLRGRLVGEVKQDSVSKTHSQGFAQPQNFSREGLRQEELQLCRYRPNDFVDPFRHAFTAKYAQALAEQETTGSAAHAWQRGAPAACHQPAPAAPQQSAHPVRPHAAAALR